MHLISATSEGQSTIGFRILGKVLQVNEMLVPDRKHGLQMSIFFPLGHNMTTYHNTNLRVGVDDGACELPHRVVEASGLLKILRNYLFSTP